MRVATSSKRPTLNDQAGSLSVCQRLRSLAMTRLLMSTVLICLRCNSDDGFNSCVSGLSRLAGPTAEMQLPFGSLRRDGSNEADC